ncbi:phosphatidate cytidylyltransferase, mitochondrial-like isoform X1 [Portunus trituberculatus]|uniref:phosphatidate cytidylyltransferase, mitochondrial-like isoform X1 n=1 Tax=Portunus trituberculatus TaxID=210409 RepID=UPI001E1CE7D2|nr:phosphatidate cytidylyltransferase, mitochondrial-like isoform X1 [Portunus trituberculatus]
MASRYARVLQSFPKGYSLAFAYGSGVFKQIGHQNVRDNMMDFIVAVRDPQAWHQVNMAQNPKHYSALRLGGPHFISRIQENWGAKIYFNTLIPTHEGMMKYGVISHSSLVADLLDWDTLYVAGRLHKPVLMLHKAAEDEELHNALKLNLYFAVHTALLLLPELFSEEQLYMTLAGLSYAGDFRMYVGEDQNKVRNIVVAQIQEFRTLYMPVLKELEEYVILDTLRGMGEQDTSPPARLYHLSMLPKRLQLMLIREWNKDGRSRDLEDVLRAAAHDTDVEDVIHKGIQDIVKISSLTQSIKGILTAGATKSVRYSWSKVKKMWKSLQR